MTGTRQHSGPVGYFSEPRSCRAVSDQLGGLRTQTQVSRRPDFCRPKTQKTRRKHGFGVEVDVGSGAFGDVIVLYRHRAGTPQLYVYTCRSRRGRGPLGTVAIRAGPTPSGSLPRRAGHSRPGRPWVTAGDAERIAGSRAGTTTPARPAITFPLPKPLLRPLRPEGRSCVQNATICYA